MIEPFLLRALAAGIGLAIIAAPLGAVLVWNRMAYFGETVAQASLVGVALGLLLNIDVTVSVVITTLAVAGLLIILGRQKLVLTHHGTLALGVIATTVLAGPSVDLMGYLFGDVFAVTQSDLWLIYGGAVIVLGVMYWLWQPLLRVAVHEELASAEGVPSRRVRAAFIVVLALVIAIAMKIVGILLAIAFLIVPVVAARPFAATPEGLVMGAGIVGSASVALGLALSAGADAPGGPAIVLCMSLIAGLSLAISARR
ncbi:MAG: metal ABC transporter permease [Hyphomonas sp.]|nr:metal ABC transporter permease [Hyphomonas sp.]